MGNMDMRRRKRKMSEYIQVTTDEFVLGESEMKNVLYFRRLDETPFKDSEEVTIDLARRLLLVYLNYRERMTDLQSNHANKYCCFEVSKDYKTVRVTIDIPSVCEKEKLN